MFGEDSERVTELIEQLKELGIPFTIHIRNGEMVVQTGGK